MEYYFLLVILSLSSFLDYSSSPKILYKFFIFSLLVLLAGTRHETGNDWGNYVDFFNRLDTGINIIELSLISKFEFGYSFINIFIKFIGGGINEVFLFISFLTILIISISIKRYTIFWFLPMLLYLRYSYLQTNMMFVRQGLALALFFYSIRYIKEKKQLKYLFTITFASFFHISVLILLPLYYIYIMKLKQKTYIFLLLLAILSVPLNLISVLANFIPFDFIRGPVLGYLSSEIWNRPSSISVSTIERLVIVLIGIIYFNKLDKLHTYFRLFFNIYFTGVLIYFISFNSYVFAERFSIYFNITAIILLVYYIKLFNGKYQKILYHIILIMFVASFFLKTIYNGNKENTYLPYKSYLYGD
jgi:hypothetical protein